MRSELAFLRGAEAFALRRELGRPPGEPAPDPLEVGAALRARLPAPAARALAEQIELERRAWAKFEDPTPLLFAREALEQASSAGVARWHAGAIPEGAAVVDVGCGLGADAMAFAASGRRTVAVDRDPARVALARHNLATIAAIPATAATESRAAGPAGRGNRGAARPALALVGDAAALPARADVLFVDPDRRPGGRRTTRLADASPSGDEIFALRNRFAILLVKAPPALPDEEIPPGAAVDFLSEDGVGKEAFLRMGEGAVAGRRRAVRLPEGLVREIEDGPPAPIADSGAWLLDPDPALRRAGGVDGLAAELGAGRVAARSTYLRADRPPDSPWARSYRVIDELPYRPRDLARRLAADPPRELVVKQRGVGLPEARVRRGLPKRATGPRRVVVLFPRGPSIRCLICEADASSRPTDRGD